MKPVISAISKVDNNLMLLKFKSGFSEFVKKFLIKFMDFDNEDEMFPSIFEGNPFIYSHQEVSILIYNKIKQLLIKSYKKIPAIITDYVLGENVVKKASLK
jgi:hypothetical protein